jgi:hypothetical protein
VSGAPAINDPVSDSQQRVRHLVQLIHSNDAGFVASLDDVIKAVSAGPAALQAKVAASVTTINGIQAASNDTASALETSDAQLTSQLQAANTNLQTAQSTVSGLTASNEKLAQEARDIQSNIDSLNDKLKWAWLAGPLAAIIAQQIGDLASGKSDKENQINRNNSAIATNNANITLAQASINQLTPQVSFIQTSVAVVDNLIKATVTLLDALAVIQAGLQSVPTVAWIQAKVQAIKIDWAELAKLAGSFTTVTHTNAYKRRGATRDTKARAVGGLVSHSALPASLFSSLALCVFLLLLFR